MQIPVEMVPAIKAPLLLQYAENDENINKGIAAYEAALTANNKKYAHLHLSRHAARLQQRHRRRALQQGGGRAGLERTLAFLAENLGAPPKGA